MKYNLRVNVFIHLPLDLHNKVDLSPFPSRIIQIMLHQIIVNADMDMAQAIYVITLVLLNPSHVILNLTASSVYQCVPVCTSVCQCVPVCASVPPCVSVSPRVCQCVPVSTSVCQCPPECASVCQCPPVCVSVPQCVPVCDSIPQCVPVSQSVCQCPPECASVHQCVPVGCVSSGPVIAIFTR
jgi:hypothetical protein